VGAAAVLASAVAAYYLAFTITVTIFGVVRGAASLGVLRRWARYARTGASDSSMFRFPWIEEDPGGGIVTAERSQLGVWNAPASEKEDKESLFSRGWHHIVEDLAKDALISGAEREALQCVPKTARRLPRECWPLNNEVSGGVFLGARRGTAPLSDVGGPLLVPILGTSHHPRPAAASSSAS